MPKTIQTDQVLEIEASAQMPEGQPQRNRRFSMQAYNGGPMRLNGWQLPVVVDLAGLEIPAAPVPVRIGHGADAVSDIFGQTDHVQVDSATVTASGDVTGMSDRVVQAVAMHDKGFKWQASIAGPILEREYIAVGRQATVNGRVVTGPVHVARKMQLAEISLVPLGADTGTSVNIAASAAFNQRRTIMKFEEWVMAEFCLDTATLQEDQLTRLRNRFDAEQANIAAAAASGFGAALAGGVAGGNAAVVVPPTKIEAQAAGSDGAAAANAFISEIRAAGAREYQRLASVRKKCGEKFPEIAASAIAQGWTDDRIDLELLRAERATGPAGHVHRAPELTQDFITATAAVGCGINPDRLVKRYGEQTIEAAAKYSGIGIQDFFRLVARSEGKELPFLTGHGEEFIQAAFSTMSLPGILSNVAHKLLLEGYNYIEQSWRRVAKIGNLNDFKPHKRYRLTEDMKFQPVSADGELKHGKLGEQTYEITGDTSGILFGLPRKMIINDDMSAFAEIPKRIGMGSAEAIAEALWALLLANTVGGADFFSTANKNYNSGADNALAIDSGGLAALETAYTKFLQQTKPNGRPLGVPPVTLLVPSALALTGNKLCTVERLIAAIATTGSKSVMAPADNVMAGKLQPVSSVYLDNATMTGYSAKAWYLFADPEVLAAAEVGFLNGQQQPTVERAEADFSNLGIQFRGFVDFGVALGDPRGGQKNKGEA